MLEVGAGRGELAAALSAVGYQVRALDPEPTGPNVEACGLHELDAAPAAFDAAVAIVSLHHVEPLAGSLTRLAEVIRPGGVLVVDEFDVAAFDRRAAGWWLRQRQGLGAHEHACADELVEEHRAHLHPLDRIVSSLGSGFNVGAPLYGPYLYRWDLDEALRPTEEGAIASGEIPAVGARLLARRVA